MDTTYLDTLFDLIAEKHLSIETLRERKSDSLDFHEVPVWDYGRPYRRLAKQGQRTKRLSRQTGNSEPLWDDATLSPANTIQYLYMSWK